MNCRMPGSETPLKQACAAISAILCLWTGGCTPPPPPVAVPRPAPASQPHPAAVSVQPVVIVQPTSSAPDRAERIYAGKVVARMTQWLETAGIPCATADDDAVARGALDQSSVAILGYNPELGFRERAALRRFFERGGKALVFYSSDPQLAALMGLRLGPRSACAGKVGSFRFNSAAPAGVPSRIEQESRSLQPAYPVSDSARVIAAWEDPIGRTLNEPAWVRSDRGFWMSHILLEGDATAKQQMLVALLGACDPGFWKAAAIHAVANAGTLGLYRDAGQTLTALDAMPAPQEVEGHVQALLAQAASLRSSMVREYENGDFIKTCRTAALLDAAVTEVYARLQTRRSPEFRGVWNHSGTGLYPGNWPETCRVLKDAGMTAVFPNVLRAGMAHYASRLAPPSETVQQYGDQILQCVQAAHAQGLEAHAWIMCWNLEDAPASLVAGFRKQGRLQASSKGESLDWLCPSDPSNRAWMADIAGEIAERYTVDGIHLDFVRFKSRDYCYCSGCRARFERHIGARVRRWPAEAVSGSLAGTYRDWRRKQIADFVAEVRSRIRKANPKVRLSAAVYPSFATCRDSIGQDWTDWIKKGLLDFACPMNYTSSPSQAIDWYRRQTTVPGASGKIYCGVGVTAAESRLNAVQTIGQIAALRGEGAAGFVLFDLNRTLERDILGYMKMGLTSASNK